jgi:hypothetical protein
MQRILPSQAQWRMLGAFCMLCNVMVLNGPCQGHAHHYFLDTRLNVCSLCYSAQSTAASLRHGTLYTGCTPRHKPKLHTITKLVTMINFCTSSRLCVTTSDTKTMVLSAHSYCSRHTIGYTVTTQITRGNFSQPATALGRTIPTSKAQTGLGTGRQQTQSKLP